MAWTRQICGWLLAIVLAGAAGPAPAADPWDEPGPIDVAPAWSLKTPDGASVRYPEDAHGQPTVLLFWPSWCPFSRALQPYVQAIWEDYRDAGVHVWTINIREDGDPLAAMRDRGLSFPLLLDGDPLMADFHISRTPWLVVIDGHGRIVYTRPAHPPTPIDVAKKVRAALNALLGAHAVALPDHYPKPYDLHLKRKEDLPDRTHPKPVAESVWAPWLAQYLAAIPDDERRADLPAAGAVADGKSAIALARALWTQAYGAETVNAYAPYRAFRKGARWVVLGDGLDGSFGSGLVLVVEVDSGQVIRLRAPTP